MREELVGKCAREQEFIKCGKVQCDFSRLPEKKARRDEGVIMTENQAGDVIKVKI